MKKKLSIILAIILVLSGSLMLSEGIKPIIKDNTIKAKTSTVKTDTGCQNLIKTLNNEDVYGWLTIKDTCIDYPVMYTPKNPQKYLRRDINGDYSVAGCLFIDGACDPETSKNTIIYGHNMHTGIMFHSLLEYENEDFYKAHKEITFYTANKTKKYEVIAAFKTTLYGDPNVYTFIDPIDIKDYDKFIAKIKAKTAYETSDVLYRENLLTLSTCSKHTKNGRFVVIAKETP